MIKSIIFQQFRHFYGILFALSTIFGTINLFAQPSNSIEASLSTEVITETAHYADSYNPRKNIQRDDLNNEILHDFNYEVFSENFIQVTFHFRTPRCYGNRFILKEYDDTIGIAVIEGTIPNAPKFCTMEAGKGNIFLKTEKPIANRKIFKLSVTEVDLK